MYKTIHKSDIAIAVVSVVLGIVLGTKAIAAHSLSSQIVLGILTIICAALFAYVIYCDFVPVLKEAHDRKQSVRKTLLSEEREYIRSTRERKEIERAALSMKRSFDKKKIDDYQMMDPFSAVDFRYALSTGPSKAFGKIERVAETENYSFYSFIPNIRTKRKINIRANKSNNCEVVFFGQDRDLSCVLGEYLVQVDHSTMYSPMTFKQIDTGEYFEVRNWFRREPGFRGHGYAFDYVGSMFVEDGKLIAEVDFCRGDFHNRPSKDYVFQADQQLVISIVDGTPTALRRNV